MMRVNGRLTPVACRACFRDRQKLSTAFWCLFRVSASILLKSFTILHFITRNTLSVLWISLRDVWITWKRIHIRISSIPSMFDVRTLRGDFLSTPFWNWPGEWGAPGRRIYTAASLRQPAKFRSHPATMGDGTHRITGSARGWSVVSRRHRE
jgi:hypothetical protein